MKPIRKTKILFAVLLLLAGMGAYGDQYDSVMVYIHGGTFAMGSAADERGRSEREGPQHQVTVNSFYMGRYPVTQAEYQAVMGTNPSYFLSGADAGEIQNKRPVENVTWYDAIEYCNNLSASKGLNSVYTITGIVITSNHITSATVTADWDQNGYRLPTEAEWEYACRAGTTTAYNTGAVINDNTGWYSINSNNKTHQVGLKPANAWGLYDMHGNVWEWCWDCYGDYSSSSQTDPTGPGFRDGRVFRGGSWSDYGQDLRSAYRNATFPWYRGNNPPSAGSSVFGFRLVRP
jgi:formylglycine-generating enzyme required for sulfatase activity